MLASVFLLTLLFQALGAQGWLGEIALLKLRVNLIQALYLPNIVSGEWTVQVGH